MAAREKPAIRPPRVAAEPAEYAAWIAAAEPRAADLAGQRRAPADERLVSVLIPVHRVPLEYLVAALDSVAAQTSAAWEACVACDLGAATDIAGFLAERSRVEPRIRVVPLATNDGISAATNAALAAARGEFVALLDHDDTLAPEALWRMQEAIRDCPEADLLYSDKDCIDADGRTRRRPLFKPGWSPEMLYSVNYLTHFNLLRRSLVEEVGGFRSHVDGAQDWDLFLRVGELARRVVRVPGVHYHWRLHGGSTSLGGVAAKPYVADAQRIALQEHLDRLGLAAQAVASPESGFQLRWRLPAGTPVHLILDGVAEGTADTGVVARMAAAALAALPAPSPGAPLRRLTVLAAAGRREAVVAACGDGATVPPGVLVEVLESSPADTVADSFAAVRRHPADGGAIVFLSGRVAVARPGWLEALVGWVTCHPEIGFCSGLIVGADETVVECGLVPDALGNATPLFRGELPGQMGILGGPMWYRNVSAASPWALAVKADGWADVDGSIPPAAAGGDFAALCRALGSAGFRGLVEPHARIMLGPGPLPVVPAFHPSVGDDPFFHPAFSSVVPLTLASGAAAAAARRPRATRRFPAAVVVAGMHRSGTSLVASLLAGAGISMGRRLLGAGRGNPRGHFEDIDFLEFHREALRACGLHGDGILPGGRADVPPGLEGRAAELIATRRAANAAWGWKDPRTLLFAEFWAERLPEAAWLLVFRSPWDVADSLYRRLDDQCAYDPLLALRAWEHANRQLLAFARRHPDRCLVRELGQITADPEGTCAVLRERFDIPLGAPPDCYEPMLLGADEAAREEQAALVRAMFPQLDGLYHELRDLAGSRVPLPRPWRQSAAPAGVVAAVSAWARGSRERTHARATADRSAAGELAAAERILILEEDRVRTAAAAAAARQEDERAIAAARAEAARSAAVCEEIARRASAETDRRLAEIEGLRAEIARLRLEGETMRLRVPKRGVGARVRRELTRFLRRARSAIGLGQPAAAGS